MMYLNLSCLLSFMNNRPSYLVLGDLKLGHLLFLTFSSNTPSVLVCSYNPNRLYRVSKLLSRFFKFSLDFHQVIFDNIYIDGECLYQYSSRLTLDICNEYYSAIVLKKPDLNFPFLRFILLKYFRRNYSDHVSVVRQVLSFSVLSKTSFPNYKLLLQCDDSFFLHNLSCYRQHIRDIHLCREHRNYFQLLLAASIRSIGIFSAYLITFVYQTKKSFNSEFLGHTDLSILKSLDHPFSDKNSRSISNYSFLKNLNLAQCFYFKSGNLFPLRPNKSFNYTSIRIISLKSLFASNTFLGNYFHFLFQVFQYPVGLAAKAYIFNCLASDFLNVSLLYSFLSTDSKIVHAFTDNNVFTDAVILYKLITDASNIDIIQLQYSCLAWPNPIMLSCADSISMFKDDFKNSFVYNDFGPRHLINSDYIFNLSHSPSSIHSKKEEIDILFSLPFDYSSYDLVIGYLDESIQVNDCWAAISFERAYSDFSNLCDFVAKYKNIALVTKPQFQINAPSNMFSSMPSLIQLINENRYYELGANSLALHCRNNLLPSVAFQDVDICIGSAFGGTASYECSLIRKRSVLIHSHEVKSPLLNIPNGDLVMFSTMTEFLKVLSRYPHRSLLSQTSIGAW